MKHTPVKSSNITSVGYDEGARELEVHFKSGGKYRYHNVDPRTHAQLLNAKSIGQHFHEHIRDAYKCTPAVEKK